MNFSFIHKIRKTFSLFKKAYASSKLQILILIWVGFASGLLEGIGINALIPLFSFAAGQPFTGANFISTFIERAFSYAHIDFSIKYLLIFIVTLFIFKELFIFYGKYLQNLIAMNYGKKLRMALLDETLEAEWGYLLNQKVGHLSTIILMESATVASLLGTISSVILTMTTLSVYVFMAFLISWQATAGAFGLGLVLIVASKPFIDKARRIVREKVDDAKELSHFINEVTLGAKAIKTSLATPRVLLKAEYFFENFRRLKIRYFVYHGAFGSAIQPISVIFISTIFVFLYKTSGFNLGSFIALVYLIQRIFSYTYQIDSNIHKINAGIPYLQSVIGYFEEIRKYRERDTGKNPFVFKHDFTLRNVSFSHDKKGDIIRNINLSVAKGDSIGIIGPSGAGKTTFVDIILRLLTPRTGALFLDGENMENISLKEWRSHVGYVSQDIHLINDTIANNISFFMPLAREEIEHAAQDANIGEFVKSLPHGFETIIGDRGVKLSMGQRQRVSIARALARKPELLIFDEATSSLDNESELRIQETVENLRGKVTMIVVAHRLSTVLNCDRVCVLNSGEIIEQGNPRALLEDKSSYFYKMYTMHAR